MTPPVNRLGAMRGPNGTTLDDLSLVLNQIRAGQVQQLANETAIRASLDTLVQRLTILSGTVSPPPVQWGGLPSYMRRVVGPPEVIQPGLSAEIQPIMEQLLFLGVRINDLVAGNPAGNTGAGDTYPLLQLRDALATVPWSSLLNRIADALRQPGELPLDSSIFRLLASIDAILPDIRDCACDGEVEPDPSLRPPPNLCDTLPGGANQIRVQAWSRLNPGGPTGIWGAVWPPSLIPPFVSLVNDTSEIYDWPGLGAEGATLDVCFSWDLTLDNITGFTSSALGTLTNWGPGNPRTPTGAALPIGVASFVMPIGAVRGLIIQNDQPDVTPSLNAFLSIGVRPT